MLKLQKYFLIATIIMIISDQLSKYILISFFNNNPKVVSINILSFLDLTYLWNKGIGFGIFHGYRYSNILFIFINFIVIFYFLSIINRLKTNLPTNVQIFSALLFGGGIGNIIDRVFRGAVFDFIWLHYYNLSLPVFNLADIGITIGILFAVCYFIKNRVK